MSATVPAPPGATETVHAERALVLAPHYDDETLGCGGVLVQLVASGCRVEVLFLSDSRGGVESVDDRDAYAAERRAEAAAATTVLGVAEVHELGLPDGSLVSTRRPLADGIRERLVAFRPDLVLVPSPLEITPDHRAVFAALHDVLTPLRSAGDPASVDDDLVAVARDLRILAYEVNHPLHPDLLVDVGAQLETIERAMACYASQQARHDYLAAYHGLSRFRTLSLGPEVRAAEAYRRLTPADFRTHSLAGLIRHLGGLPAALMVDEGPRVSVIVRTKDRPALLAEALDSLAASTYRNAEVVLVNDGGAPPVVPDGYPLAVQRVDLETNRGRAAAANLGVRQATGDLVAFLDDDDRVEPEHLATLAGLVSAAGVEIAYTDAAVGVYELDGDGWVCRSRRLPYSRDFDPDRLLVDNYIPFNTVVIPRQRLLDVGLFDETLPFFEDWDLLIRLSAEAPFHHLARVTCEYRQFRGAGHHVLGDRAPVDFQAMKARVLERHRERLDAGRLAGVVMGLREEVVVATEAEAKARDERDETRQSLFATRGTLAHAESELRALATVQGRTDAELEALRKEATEQRRELERLYGRERELVTHQAEQDDQLRATYAEIERLGEIIRAMERTRAWRVHQWWQRRK